MFVYPLLWKEFTLRRKAWIQTPCELLLMVFSIWIIYSTSQEEKKQWKRLMVPVNASTADGTEITGRMIDLKDNLPYIVYYPSTSFTDRVMNYDSSNINGSGLEFSGQNIKEAYQTLPLKNEEELEEYISKYNSRVPAAFTFYDQKSDNYLSPKSDIKNGIRIKLRSTFFVAQKGKPVNTLAQPFGIDLLDTMLSTVERRAVSLQLNLDRDIGSYYYTTADVASSNARQMVSVYAIFLAFGTILTLYVLVKRIVTEKTTKLRELMNLSGMTNKIYNESIIIFHLAIILPFALICAILVSDMCHLVLVFFAYIWFALICVLYAMAFTVFVNQVTVAKTLFVILWLGVPVLLMYYLSLPMNDKSAEVYTLLCCLFAPPTFAIGIFHQICHRYIIVNRMFLPLEATFKHIPTLEYLTPGHILAALHFQLFLSALVVVYVGEIWPWQEGIPKPWYYPFSTLMKQKKKSNSSKRNKTTKYFEQPPQNLECIISVEDVTKRFSRDVLKGVNLQIYRGQITVLLGHNGAGKTTLMSIMTGLFPATTGQVLINGHNVETNIETARKDVGLCPQINIQYDSLTVEEHLYFFGLMKGYNCKKIKSEIDRVLKLLNLEKQRHLSPSAISGGMKRKLQLAIAFIGGSTILILDEPSSGLDIETRRVVWDMLLSVREKYVILITTHHMEEADCLGDRIAIMSQGDIVCCGTPMFLKKAFGVGYFLRVAKMDSFNESATKNLFAKHLETLSPYKNSEKESIFTFSKKETPKLPDLLDELDQVKKIIGVSSVGISVTSMDDVFLKVGTVFEKTGEDDDSKVPTVEHLKKPPSPKTAILALLFKRFHNMKRKPFTLLSFLLLVFAFSLGFVYLMCDRDKFESNEWQTEMNFAEIGIRSAKGICVNHTDFCNVVKQIGDPFSISFEVKNMSKSALESSIASYTTVGIAVNNLQFDNGEISQKIQIYTPVNEPYITQIATTIVTNALYSYNTSSNVTFTTTTFNPQKTIDINFLPDTKSLILVPIMYLIVGLYPMLYPVMERKTNVKLLQLMTGVSFFEYWLSNLVFDFLLLLFFSIPFFILIFCFYFAFGCVTAVNSIKTLALFTTVIIVYFLSTTSMSHLLSHFFEGIAVVLLIKLAIFIAAMSVFAIPVDFIQDMAKHFLAYVLPVYPLIGMYNGVNNVSLYANVDNYCSKLFYLWPDYCKNKENFQKSTATTLCCEDFFNETIGWKFLVQQTIQVALFVGFFVTTVAIEYILETRKKIKFEDSTYKAPITEDSDVSDMRSKAAKVFQSNEQKKFALSTLNMTKRYNPIVVDHLSFLVQPKQCFGLLGVNGAGKTTTFKMLISEISMTYGESFIGSYSVFKNTTDYQKSIGYCPQFDAFVANLTGRETLYLFARLRGYIGRQLKEVVESIIKLVDLQDHAKYVADNYSGGNKRKLSIGMAIIGFPRLMFFDEPTAGVDPVARRKVWKIIETCRETFGSSLILTSHSMDECEYLCTVIAIMVKGTFRCIGSTQHLKTKFGKGVTITLKLDPNMKNLENVKKDVNAVLPKALLKDSHTTQITYHCDDPNISLGNIFRILESIKVKHKLEDYQVTNSDLEQIFLAFAREQ